MEKSAARRAVSVINDRMSKNQKDDTDATIQALSSIMSGVTFADVMQYLLEEDRKRRERGSLFYNPETDEEADFNNKCLMDAKRSPDEAHTDRLMWLALFIGFSLWVFNA